MSSIPVGTFEEAESDGMADVVVGDGVPPRQLTMPVLGPTEGEGGRGLEAEARADKSK